MIKEEGEKRESYQRKDKKGGGSYYREREGLE